MSRWSAGWGRRHDRLYDTQGLPVHLRPIAGDDALELLGQEDAQDRVGELADSPSGLRYLKLRSLSRKEHLESLFAAAGLPKPDKAKAMLRVSFECDQLTHPQSVRQDRIEERADVFDAKRLRRTKARMLARANHAGQ
jgi:hypothetical protein